MTRRRRRSSYSARPSSTRHDIELEADSDDPLEGVEIEIEFSSTTDLPLLIKATPGVLPDEFEFDGRKFQSVEPGVWTCPTSLN